MLSRRRFLAATAALGVSTLRAEPAPHAARPLTRGPKHHFFGYYDKCAYDAANARVLAHEIDFADRMPKAGEPITLGTVDLTKDNAYTRIDETPAWCWQQGAMLQWRPGTANEVVYNSVRDGKYVAVVRDLHAGTQRTLPLPVHFVRPDGLQAVTLDYDRLHRLRPGYGYAALPELNPADPAPADMGCHTLDLLTGDAKLAVSLKQLSQFEPNKRFAGAHHYINHMQYTPSGHRFLFLHRWTQPGSLTWGTRLFTAKPDGSDLRLVLDPSMFSHFDWKDDATLLAWTRDAKGTLGFYLFPDAPKAELQPFDAGVLTRDGHCSYSPDRKWVLNDTYPDNERMQTLMLVRVSDGRRFDLGKFFSPKQYTGPIRCDLHPRWNRDGTRVCFDSTHEGGLRQVYEVDVADVTGH